MTVEASLYEWLLFGHIVAATVWVGGAVLLGASVTGVLRSREPEGVARFVANLRFIGPRMLAPATVAVPSRSKAERDVSSEDRVTTRMRDGTQGAAGQ